MRILRKIAYWWQIGQTKLCDHFGRNYQCKCGHTAKYKTVLVVDGRPGVYTIGQKEARWCPQCWLGAAIQCAWCGETIMPGDALTLYTPRKGFEVPKHAVVYQQEPSLQLVGCLRWNCAESGVDRAGFWIMPGKVQRVMSPLEILAARGGDEPIILGDLTDPREAIPFPE